MLTALTRLLYITEKTSLLLTPLRSIVKFVTISIDKNLCDLFQAGFMMLEQTYANRNHAYFIDVLFVHYRLIQID